MPSSDDQCMVLCQGGVVTPGERGSSSFTVGEDVVFHKDAFAGEQTDIYGNSSAMGDKTLYVPRTGDRVKIVSRVKTISITYSGRAARSANEAASHLELTREVTLHPHQTLTAKDISRNFIALKEGAKVDASSVRFYLLKAPPLDDPAHIELPAALSPSYFMDGKESPLVLWCALEYDEVNEMDHFVLKTSSESREKRVTVNDLWGNSIRLSIPSHNYSTATHGVAQEVFRKSDALLRSSKRRVGMPENPLDQDATEFDHARRIGNVLPNVTRRFQRLDGGPALASFLSKSSSHLTDGRVRRHQKSSSDPLAEVHGATAPDAASESESLDSRVSKVSNALTPSPDSEGDELTRLCYSDLPTGQSEYRLLYGAITAVVYHNRNTEGGLPCPVLAFEVTQMSTHGANLASVVQTLVEKQILNESEVDEQALTAKYTLISDADNQEVALVHGERLCLRCKKLELRLRADVTSPTSPTSPTTPATEHPAAAEGRTLPKLYLRQIFVTVFSAKSAKCVRIGCDVEDTAALTRDATTILAEVQEEAMRIFGITGVGRGSYELTGPGYVQDGSAYCLVPTKASVRSTRSKRTSSSGRSAGGTDLVATLTPKYCTVSLDGVSHICEVYPATPRDTQACIRAAVGLATWGEVSVMEPADLDPVSITFNTLPAVLILESRDEV